MKKMFLLVSAFVMSSGAFAAAPEVWAKQVSCQELKDTLANYGEVTIKSRLFGLTNSTTVYLGVNCGPYQREVSAYFSVKDTRFCQVGSYCQRAGGGGGH